MRWMPLLLCLALAGCVTEGDSDGLGSNVQAQAVAPASAPAAPRPSKPQQAKAEDDAWWQQGVTRENISALCWMKYEEGRKDLPLEKRADLVNKCVADVLKEHPVPR